MLLRNVKNVTQINRDKNLVHYQTLPQYASFALTGYATALACFLLPASLLAKRFSNRTIFLLGLSSCAQGRRIFFSEEIILI